MMDYDSTKPVIIFDSSCMLCTKSINFFLEHERAKDFLFTPLNGAFAKSINVLDKYKYPIPDSVILYYQDKIYLESTAVLKATKWLNSPYSKLSWLLFIPAFIRNFFYKIIAKNRYKWFGTHEDNCYWVPPDERYRFLR